MDTIVEQAPVPSKTNWQLWLLIIGIIGWALSGFFAYSLKKTTDEVKQLSTQLASTHQEAVTISVPMDVNGKIVYKTITKTIHDTLNEKTNLKEEKKTVEIYKSGVSIGGGLSTKGSIGGLLQADLLPLGPATLQVGGLVAKDEQWALLSGRILF